MPRPSRARRILKWTGVWLSLLILATWAASLRYQMTLALTSNAYIGIEPNLLIIASMKDATVDIIDTEIANHRFRGLKFEWPQFGLDWASGACPASSNLIFGGTWIILPFWFLLLATAIPTAWLWHRDQRRIPPGCCPRCGYDLTGNTSGVCSECGMAKPPFATV